MPRSRWPLAFLVFLVVGIAGLGVRPLVVPDETRYGMIPAEMVRTGDWLALRMAGFTYYEKPPLGYWLTAASIGAFGENAFAIRLPSAVATAVVGLVAAWLAVRIGGRRDDGPLAFLVQATTLGPLVLGTVALLDPPFAAFVALSMAALHGGCSSQGRARAGWLALAGIAAGFAFLTKGLLAFAIPGASALAFLAWERRWKDMLTMPWIPLAAAAATVAPFAWAIHRREPGFWEYFIVVEHFRRAARPDGNQHPEPWWHFLAVFPVGAMLWTLAWPNAWKGMRGAAEWRSGIRFLVSWAVAPIVLLSLSSGKLATYVLPMYAPVAVLVALGLVRGRALGRIVLDRPALVARFLLRAFAAAALLLAFLGLGSVGIPSPWESGEGWRLAAIGIALLAWAQLDAWSWRAPDGREWLARTALAPIPVLACIPFLYPDALLSGWKHPWPLLDRHAAELRGSALLMASAGPAHPVCWAAGRSDIVIVGDPSEFDNELGIAVEEPRKIDWKDASARIAAALSGPGGSAAVVVPDPMVDAVVAGAGLRAPDIRESFRGITLLGWR